MFSPLYVGLYLFKSYTGEGEDDEQHGTDEEGVEYGPGEGVNSPREAVKQDGIDKRIVASEENDSAIEGILEENKHKPTESLENTKWPPFQIPNPDETDDVSNKFYGEMTNNNTCIPEGQSRDFEYKHSGKQEDENNGDEKDELGSTEFVDSQPVTEVIKSATIKQNQEILNEFIEKNEVKADETINDTVNISPLNFRKEMLVAERKCLMQDAYSANEDIHVDIKGNSPCNNNTSIESFTAANKQFKRHNDVLPITRNEFDLSDKLSHISSSYISEAIPDSGNLHNNSSYVKMSSENVLCDGVSTVSSVQIYDASLLNCVDGIDQGSTAVQTIESPSMKSQEISNKVRVHKTNGLSKTTNEVSLQGYEATVKNNSNEPVISKETISSTFTHSNMEQGEKSVKDVDNLSNTNDSPSSSDSESDLSDTIVEAHDVVSSDGDASDLPDDGTASLFSSASRPTNLDLINHDTVSEKNVNKDIHSPPVLSPSKVLVTCINEEETILVEEVVIPSNQQKLLAGNSDKIRHTLLPESASSHSARFSPFSSTECLDFDWNEHCLRMIVTGTPDNSLKIPVTGTSKSPINRLPSPTQLNPLSSSKGLDGSLLYGSRDLKDMNEDMRVNVKTLRSEMKNKNEEISRLKNITHGLRHRLTQVEQENVRLSQSNDSFLSVRSATPSDSGSCYTSVVSLSYEDSQKRSPSLEENLLLKEEILLLKAKLNSKSDTIEQLNSETKELKARLIQEKHDRTKSESGNEKKKVPRRKIRTVKSVNDISVEEMPHNTPPSSAGSASSVFVNSATLQIPTLFEQTSKKSKSKKIRKLFSFKKKKDKSK